MASFQVEIASTSSSFGYTMRNLSRHDRCSSSGSTSFPENLKDFVHSCISGETRNSDIISSEENVNITDLWVHKPQYLANENQNSSTQCADKGNKASDNWDKARKKVLLMERNDEDNEGLVSSLLQRWRDFEAESKALQFANNIIGSASCSRTNSGLPENVELPRAEASDEEMETPTEDDSSTSFLDWESDRRAVSAPPSVRGRDSDATESERVRVIDIIKKLTSSGGGDETPDRDNNNNSSGGETMSFHRVKTPAEPSYFCSLMQSPRIIRGRQALTDLLVQMERERARELDGLTERKPVSKFQQKGRIQAILKLRFLRREAEGKDATPSSRISPESVGLTQSSIMHLREKFKAGEVQPKLTQSKSMSESRTTSTSKPKKESLNLDNSIRNNKEATERISTRENVSTSKQLQEDESSGDRHNKATETTKPVVENEDTRKTEHTEQRKTVTWMSDWEENDWSWVNEYTHQHRGSWDQLHIDFQQQEGEEEEEDDISQDWINDVSRPRSEWEDLRQARYQEMLDPFFNNDDLQQLLHRKSVSSFLAGSLRDKIDRLMISRTQKQSTLKNNEVLQTQEQISHNKKENVVEEVVQDEVRGKTYQEDEDDDDGDDDNDYNQHWNHNQECDIRDEYDDHMASTPLPQFNSSNNNNHFFSQVNEMNLVHELMRHMEQLHLEMSEIRSAIVSCIDMQMKLQDSIKTEVTSAFNQLEKKSCEDSSKRKCNICHERLVDSLLYRCGHMCTCLKCAQELQWGGGKCPKCQAPIEDVVRAYGDA